MRPGREQVGSKTIRQTQSILVTIYLLELIGATAVTSLGWAACGILRIDWIPSAPLWFAGYLLVYNLDRLYQDPADRVNTPVRAGKSEELQRFRVCLVVLSATVLLVWPLLTSRWWLVLAEISIVGLLYFYSRPIPRLGFRLKDIPYIKSLIAPGLIAGILVVWPCVENGRSFRWKESVIFVWCLLALTINSLVFDYRDIEGDTMVGTRTIPLRLGRRNTVLLLLILTTAWIAVSGWLEGRGLVRPLMPAVLTGGSAGLLFALTTPLSPITISMLADLVLILPAAVQFFG
jgi:4-hydroxybenzoate polyprenyltransferase